MNLSLKYRSETTKCVLNCIFLIIHRINEKRADILFTKVAISKKKLAKPIYYNTH
jgi:hypothetical protein